MTKEQRNPTKASVKKSVRISFILSSGNYTGTRSRLKVKSYAPRLRPRSRLDHRICEPSCEALAMWHQMPDKRTTNQDLPASSLTGTDAGCRLTPTQRVRNQGQIHPFEKFRRKHEKSLMGHSACRDVAVCSPQPCAKSELRCRAGVARHLLPHQTRSGRSVLERLSRAPEARVRIVK